MTDVVFLGDGPFHEGERVLLEKMIAAMRPTGAYSVRDDAAAWLTEGGSSATKLVITLGAKATAALEPATAFGGLRGKCHEGPRGTTMLATAHPRDLLREPAAKREAWADLQRAMAELGIDP